MNTEQRFEKLPGIDLANLSGDKDARVMAISSGRHGDGTTSVAINLAVELARLNKQVCLLDGNSNPAHFNLYAGLPPHYTLHDVLSGDKLLENVMFNGPAGISIIPAASCIVDSLEYDDTQQQQIIDIIRRLESAFDYILIDPGAGINQTGLNFIELAPEIVMTITTDPDSLKSAFPLLKLMSGRGFDRPLRLVVNRARSTGMAEFTLHLFSTAVKLFLGLETKSSIHIVEDDKVPASIPQHLPYVLLYPETPASRCIRNFACKLIEERQYPLLKLSECLLNYKTPELEADETAGYEVETEQDAIEDYGYESEQDDTAEYPLGPGEEETVEYAVETEQDQTDDYGYESEQDETAEYAVETEQDAIEDYGYEPAQDDTEEYAVETEEYATEEYSSEPEEDTTGGYLVEPQEPVTARAVVGQGAEEKAETAVNGSWVEQADSTIGSGSFDQVGQLPDQPAAQQSKPEKASDSADYLTAIRFASALNKQLEK